MQSVIQVATRNDVRTALPIRPLAILTEAADLARMLKHQRLSRMACRETRLAV
jgi:hypothetical protein